MKRGSCWPSSSIVTIQSPRATDMPAMVAASCPKLRLSHTTRTWGYRWSSSWSTTSERSGPLSWTRTISSTT
ncbi:Uncharacterised protein [Mycobacteroides abscessus subsp. abscessus]|nr:Uncharacterised protein [Mycobacteroides abscessus subsp. abscessus]